LPQCCPRGAIMPKKMLTDRALKALWKKPAKSGKRYEIGDKDVSGLLCASMTKAP
jgi:hypothetical protein